MCGRLSLAIATSVWIGTTCVPHHCCSGQGCLGGAPCPGERVAGPVRVSGGPCTPLESWLGCVEGPGPVRAPVSPVEPPVAAPGLPPPGARVEGPVLVSGGPCTPGPDVGRSGLLIPAPWPAPWPVPRPGPCPAPCSAPVPVVWAIAGVTTGAILKVIAAAIAAVTRLFMRVSFCFLLPSNPAVWDLFPHRIC